MACDRFSAVQPDVCTAVCWPAHAPPPAAPLAGSAPPALLQFIFISPEEMQAVADFIRQRGRIAIGELAAKSSMFVDLEARQVAGAAAQLELELPVAGS